MQSLSLPPPASLPSTPFGRRPEPGSSLVKFPPQFSPGRPEPQSYPSPPMSDSHSPARRSAHIVEPESHPYPHPHPLNDSRRPEGIAPPPPPPPSLLDPRTAASSQGYPHPRPLYPGEPQPRAQPLHYQPGRAIEPHYGAVQVPNYAYGYPSSGVPSYLGSQGPGPGPQAQPTAIIAPPPLRQNKPARRTKAHVASACVNCKKAHLSCDVQRPCGRCVASGKQETCKDVQHKKRGRPRLRDDKEFGRSEDARTAPSQLMGAPSTSGPEPYPLQSPFITHRAPEPPRVLGSTREEDIANIRQHHTTVAQGRPPPRVGSYSGVAAPSYSAGPNSAYQMLPVAFLNLDLVIHKSNQAFQDLASFLGDVRGKSLAELLEGRQHDVLHRLRSDLREERDDREPTYMAPITPVGQDPMQSVMQSVSERDIDQVSQGCIDRPLLLNFRLQNGQYQSLQTQIRLAKTSLYFVTLVVRTPPRPAGPPLLTQQLAPPTPVHASQTRSAPTASSTREFGSYPVRPSSSASSAPTSPYFNFNSVRTSLPTISSSSYGNSPSYGYSPTAGPEQGYFPTYQPPSQPGAYPSAYQSASRTASITSEPQRDTNRSVHLERLQLPPIRTAPAPPLASPTGYEFGEGTRERVRRRESPTSADPRPETPDKRRRLNIHEVLE
ncbi:hypothetical protein K458DRAFT_287142 [Lentithecium fluviatile CBS 122367]|uniref:Zn(2)-C6 fungal-type domain-containing protein n=1 Tax=Lentithecium fluviatile CBS 122367 TaxID=1168545 RepID=A0A6G1JL42_9PLEO|nr:hypothetical protein K458DRAFT_287142 [Lentithecium fluviatile CBS 122367]